MGVLDEVGVNFVAYHDIRSWRGLRWLMIVVEGRPKSICGKFSA
jgi:hypothetical protein